MDWPQAWYPLCAATAVARGRVIGVFAFNKRLAVFRSHDGRLGGVAARCGHFGADLSRGTVVQNHLRCPLHGRCFAVDGTCAEGHVGQESWPVAEGFGIVFGYLGTGQPPPLPAPDGSAAGLITSARVTEDVLDLAAIGANAFDAAHLGPVHGRELTADPVVSALAPDGLRIAFTARIAGNGWRDRLLRLAGIREVCIDTDCWSGNLLIFHHRRIGTWTLHAAVPIDDVTTRVFTVSGCAGQGWAQRLRLALHHRTALGFIAEDRRALAGTIPGVIALDPVIDRTLIAWLAYYAALPRTSP